jgi:Mn-dependent DtxR family transcriptional regulator
MAARSMPARERMLAKILALVERNPGIRPSEINRRLKLTQSDALRAELIRRGLVRKVKSGRATLLYAK